MIMIWGVINLFITLIFSGMIPHRYASAQEGREIMLSNTEYYDNMTQNDLDFRMRKSGATKEELLAWHMAATKPQIFGKCNEGGLT